ncbi:TetR/AcrR family transcriptional regulator [Psychrobacter sp. YP14]|jgi:AcrR family transcriptional regulator|uniref:TetR family transcriptional regulator n=3 Tax=Psychrobacter TaxID=497 RepID=A0A844M3A3_9GAMM|nr:MULTISPECIES: TetR/AcrR family transcriptional regulator [Psychrobacter]AWT49631.1 TetR/AcrR family transcriptional regulator [Psychrobacter sp. YP14]MUG33007.1 TetR family transcriptional regulator [Psychrobacter sanguinis]
MSRQQQFKNREEKILATAEQLLLEAGSGDITLDSLADQLDLAKGTLYKHFSSKDELYLRIIIRYEEQLFDINKIDDSASAGVSRMILQQLMNPQKALLFNQIEERLAASAQGLNRMFGELYEIRRARMKRLIDISSQYLQTQNSGLSTRDYLSTIWAIGQGGASLLNSSFYQRYLGRRDTLRVALIQQMLDLPKQYPSLDEEDDDMVDLVNQIDSESEAHMQSQAS